MTTITELLRDLESRGFFGSLEIKFENGRVVHLTKHENIKPSDYRTGRGDGNGDRPH